MEIRSWNTRYADEDDVVSIPGVRCTAATAYSIRVNRGGGSIWVPQSVVHDDSEVWRVGDVGTLVVARWWAEKNGIKPRRDR